MDFYQEVLKRVMQNPSMRAWPQAQEILTAAAKAHLMLWQFPLMACRAVSGAEELAMSAAAAVACAHASIHLIDDVLDDDPRGEQQRYGAGYVANLASALQAVGVEALEGCPTSAESCLAACASLNRALAATALGQAWDSQNPSDEAAYWQTTEMKGSPLFATAFEMGALLGGAAAETASALAHLGALYGVLIQISDDLSDSLETPANTDWLQNRWPLPILFARVVDHPDRERFLALRSPSMNLAELEEAQEILVRCGAVSYCVDQLVTRHAEAQRFLAHIPLARRDEIEQLLAEMIHPTLELLHLSLQGSVN